MAHSGRVSLIGYILDKSLVLNSHEIDEAERLSTPKQNSLSFDIRCDSFEHRFRLLGSPLEVFTEYSHRFRQNGQNDNMS